MTPRPRLEPLRSVRTDALEIAYLEARPSDAEVALLLHGYPCGIHSYVDVTPRVRRRKRVLRVASDPHDVPNRRRAIEPLGAD